MRYSRVERFSLVEDCYNSGLTVKEWCTQNGINKCTFNNWATEYNRINPENHLSDEAKSLRQIARFHSVEDRYNGGLTRKQWCKESNVNENTFHSWIKEYNRVNPENQFRSTAKLFRQARRFHLVEDCYNSGLTVNEWCKQNNISADTFRHWVLEYNRVNPENHLKHRAKRRSQEERFQIVEECRNSALTIEEWCKRNNLNAGTFMSWATEYNHVNPESQLRRTIKERRQEEWFRLVEECYHSGLTAKEWCKRYDIKVKTFSHWVVRYNRTNPGNQLKDILKSSRQAKRFQIVEECRNSGLSDEEWCKQNNINVGTFGCWATEYNHANPENCIRHNAKKRSNDEWFRLVEEWRNSGLIIQEWCEQNSINEGTFRHWVAAYNHVKLKNPINHRAKRHSQDKRFQLVEEWYNSGLTADELCKRNGIKVKTFRAWRWEYNCAKHGNTINSRAI